MKNDTGIGHAWRYPIKFNLSMKLTTILLIVSTLSIQANSYSQKTRITCNLENVRITEVFEDFEKNTAYKFLYNHREIDTERRVSIKANQEPLESVLKRLLAGLDITYVVKKKQIILRHKEQNDVDEATIQQSIQKNNGNEPPQLTITGLVADKDGVPLLGASIVEKGTTNGTQTDFDGNFELEVSDPNVTLVVSFIGFATKEIALNGQTEFTITLDASAAGLDEVIIVGYGTQKKRNVAGSISSIDGDAINNAVTGNPTQALVGQATGVRVETSGGAPGAAANVIIRGTGSLSNQNPLYVVDGVFSDDINFLNPSDIESIQVLKDASTASIYGARSGQGVIIVTTKKGTKGQAMKIDLDISSGFASAVRQLDYLNAAEYIANRTQAFTNDGTALPGNFNDFDPSIDSDIQDASLRNAFIQNYGLRISGGGESSTYSISANRLEQEGIVQASDFERTTFRLNTSSQKGRFSFNQSLFLARSINRPNLDFGGEFGHLPIVPILDESLDGGYAAANTGVAGISRSTNFLGVAKLTERRITSDNVLGNVSGAFEIIDGLKYTLNLSLNYSNSRNFTFVPTYFTSNSDVGSNPIADLTDDRTTFLSTIVESLLSYKKSFGNHNIDALAGYSEQRDNTERLSVSVENFLSNETRTVDAAIDAVGRIGTSLPRRIKSVFGRLNYDYAGKYLLTASIRRDGSSNFGIDNRYGTFPSIGLGWNISEEDFFNVDFIDNLKVRGSRGKLGSDNLVPFQYVTALNITSEAVIGEAQQRLSGVSQIQFSNPDLKWEETTTTDIGLEASLLGGKIDVTLDYFKKKSEDILANLPINPTSGTNVAIPFNAATVENKGFEFSMTYKKNEGDFNYAITGNLTTLDNTVVDLGEGVNPINGGGFTDESLNATRTEAGFPVAYFYGYKTNGVYQNQAEIDADNLSGRTAVPGDFRFVDLNGDGILDATDQTLLGSPIPDFEYSLSFNANYKDLDFRLFFQGVQGNEIWNGRAFEGTFAINGNKLGVVRDAWTPTNPSNSVPRASISDPGLNRRASDYYVESGSYFRLQNVTLGYTFPTSITDKIALSKLRAYINVENAFIIDSYSGYFPEIGRNVRRSNSLFDRGVDEGAFPTARTITLGLQVSL
ncbi:MAG: TonB-dependent receptor [Flavobacteriaceae bacterium]